MSAATPQASAPKMATRWRKNDFFPVRSADSEISERNEGGYGNRSERPPRTPIPSFAVKGCLDLIRSRHPIDAVFFFFFFSISSGIKLNPGIFFSPTFAIVLNDNRPFFEV